MKIKIGNFIFRIRNILFPVFYSFLFVDSPSLLDSDGLAFIIGASLSFTGQFFRIITIGLQYIVRGGRKQKIYAEQLVTSGMFAHCRNPLYLGNLLMIIGLAVAANSTLYMIFLIPLFIFSYWFIISAEENFLLRNFGGEYEKYCHHVNRILPSFRGLSHRLRQGKFNWRRIVVKEYGTVYIWTLALVLIAMENVSQQSLVFRTVYQPWLWGAVVFLTCCYLCIRYLKKSRRLQG